MNLPDGCYLDYVIPREAWCSRVVANEPPEMQIRASAKEGGCAWEFAVVQIEDIGVQVRVFDDAWHAFNDIAEFFERLAASGKNTTLADIRRILDNLGAVDGTQRIDPHRALKYAAAFGNVQIST